MTKKMIRKRSKRRKKMKNKVNQRGQKTKKNLKSKGKSLRMRTPKNHNKLRAHRKYSSDDDKSKDWLAILTIDYFEEMEIRIKKGKVIK